MSKNKARVERLENIKGADDNYIFIGLGDKRTNEQIEAENPSVQTIYRLERKELGNPRNIDIDE